MRLCGGRTLADTGTQGVHPRTGRDGRWPGSRTDLVDTLLGAPHLEGSISNLLAAGNC